MRGENYFINLKETKNEKDYDAFGCCFVDIHAMQQSRTQHDFTTSRHTWKNHFRLDEQRCLHERSYRFDDGQKEVKQCIYSLLKSKVMMDNSYHFGGMHMGWWVFVLIIFFGLLVWFTRFRKRK